MIWGLHWRDWANWKPELVTYKTATIRLRGNGNQYRIRCFYWSILSVCWWTKGESK